jgi:hypothetical protein
MKVMRVTSVVGFGFVAMMLVACAADDAPPSCQQAFDHFYAASCTFVDSAGPIPKATAISQCEALAVEEPRSCRDEFYDWLRCVNAVPSPATSDEQCSCSPAVAALRTCQ